MKKLLLLTESIAASFLLLIALLVCCNVVLRGVLNITVPDWYDGSRLLLGIAMCWGVAVTTFRGGHICVDALWEYCAPRNRRRLDIFASIAVMLFFAPTAWMVWQKVVDSGGQATADMRLPVAAFYALAACGITAAAVLAAARVGYIITGRSTEDLENHGS